MSIPEIVFLSALGLPTGLGIGIFFACGLLGINPAAAFLALCHLLSGGKVLMIGGA